MLEGEEGCQAMHPPPAALSRGSSGSARCSAPPAPLGDALQPLLHLPARSRSQFPRQEESTGPKSGWPAPGDPPSIPEGTAGHGHSHGHRHRDPWPRGHPLCPPPLSRVLQPHRHRGHREGAPGGCFSHGTPSPKPCSARSSGRLHRLKMAKAARGSPDSRGVQPSFRGTKAQTKITQDNAEELFVPARGRGQAPARPHSRFFRASHPPPAAASTFRLPVLLISFPPRRDVLELVLHSLLPPEPLQGRGRVKPPGFRSFFGVCSCWGRQVCLPGAHRPHGAGAPRVPLLLWGHWGPEMSFPSLLEV